MVLVAKSESNNLMFYENNTARLCTRVGVNFTWWRPWKWNKTVSASCHKASGLCQWGTLRMCCWNNKQGNERETHRLKLGYRFYESKRDRRRRNGSKCKGCTRVHTSSVFKAWSESTEIMLQACRRLLSHMISQNWKKKQKQKKRIRFTNIHFISFD